MRICWLSSWKPSSKGIFWNTHLWKCYYASWYYERVSTIDAEMWLNDEVSGQSDAIKLALPGASVDETVISD